MITLSKGEKKTLEITDGGEYIVRLTGEGAEVVVNERFDTNKSRITIIHDAPKTVSRVYSRGVLRAAQDSLVTIKIPNHAKGSDSYVHQRALLIGNGSAQMTPSLEIETNDVKAGHAATVQPLDDAHIFYLMSRGLKKDEATALLIDAFMEAQ